MANPVVYKHPSIPKKLVYAREDKDLRRQRGSSKKTIIAQTDCLLAHPSATPTARRSDLSMSRMMMVYIAQHNQVKVKHAVLGSQAVAGETDLDHSSV
mmetsp:Transcript_557/g.1274  ORF Transcript_557/g.1274 Transcript_557/m.1274 type:complete len:98 (-) Transcript_557:444-737(-)